MRAKSEARRQAIVDAASQVFLEHGYDAASVAQVSARLGGSKQTLYSYFTSKQELFVVVMLERGAKKINPLFEGFRQQVDIKTALEAFGIGFLQFMFSKEALGFRRMIVAEGFKSNLGKLFYENGPKRGWAQMCGYFEEAMADGRLRCADAKIATEQFQALLEAGPLQRRLEGVIDDQPEADIVKTVHEAVDVFMRAYGASESDVAVEGAFSNTAKRHVASPPSLDEHTR